jgi:hypothetical protein
VRIGAIGGRVKGMTEIAYDEFSIKQKLGARVVNLDEKEMTEKVAAMSDEEAEQLLEEKQAFLKPCKILSTKDDMLESIKYSRKRCSIRASSTNPIPNTSSINNLVGFGYSKFNRCNAE